MQQSLQPISGYGGAFVVFMNSCRIARS